MANYVATWGQVDQLLREARAQLASPHGSLNGALVEFEEFLQHNELELAWDALSEIGDQSVASTPFWEKLSCAAGLMNLSDKQRQAEEKCQECHGRAGYEVADS